MEEPDPIQSTPKKRRKVDYEALYSPFTRIPGMDLATVRDLLDIGLQEVDELRGRAPEVLFEQILDLREQTPADRLALLRMAVYFAETDSPDPALLQPHKWRDPH